ncbi:MAG: hypothetical protein AAGE94_01855 [Acidobacteriota bacterium]
MTRRVVDLLLRRPLPTFAVLFVVALAAATAEDGYRAWRADRDEPGLGGRWIWAPEVADAGQPVTFWAIRDVRLDAPRDAWLSIVADEEYVLHVNGRRVGAGVYRPGNAADLYDISTLLDGGLNRILVELRSTRGAGGLLASLRLDARDRVALTTDDSWRIARRADVGLLDGSLALDDPRVADLLIAPRVWPAPPTGRWRPAPPVARPLAPSDWRPPTVDRPTRVRGAIEGTQWQTLDPDAPVLLGGEQSLYDLGHTVTGFVELRFDPASPIAGRPLLLFFGDDPPLPAERPADAVAVPMPGRYLWCDVQPRQFRYVTVLGGDGLVDLQVIRTSPEHLAASTPPPASSDGVFGLPPVREVGHAEAWVRERLPRRGDDEPTP